MAFFKTISHWWHEALRKRRLSIEHAASGEEEGHLHLSPAGLFSAFVALLLILFFLILSLVAYTPILEFLPGYRTEATRSREDLVSNIMRLDSMERVMEDMLTYYENVSLVLDGRSPVVRSITDLDSTRVDKTLVLPNEADSALRAQMEGSGSYALNQGSTRRSVREAIEMITPVDGIITRHFNLKEQHFGVEMAAAAEAEIAAVDEGTVLLTLWSPDTGYLVQIQHPNNLLSIYKHLGQTSVSIGQRLRRGELIGTAGDSSKADAHPFVFELWSNGKAVDPEAYIVF